MIDPTFKEHCIQWTNANADLNILSLMFFFHVACILQALKDLHLTFEAKQRAIGVPVEELCAKPPEGSRVEKESFFLDLPAENPLSS